MPRLRNINWFGSKGLLFRATWTLLDAPPVYGKYQNGLFHTGRDGKKLYYRKVYKQEELAKGLKNYSELVDSSFDISNVPIASIKTQERILKALKGLTYE